MSALLGGAQAFGLSLDDAQLRAFDIFQAELLAWNAKFNLTAITGAAEITSRHFLDSLSLLAAGSGPQPLVAMPASALTLIDVGAGAGFPAIPLKIVRPAWRVTLLEATRKKCDFLEQLVAVLQLSGTRVVWARAETAGHLAAERERYDLVVARAVAVLNVLAEYMLPLARVGGQCVAWKGDAVDVEVSGAKRAIGTLGGRLRGVQAVQVPGIDQQRHLIVIDKVTPTLQAYPRRDGVPAKKPLR